MHKELEHKGALFSGHFLKDEDGVCKFAEYKMLTDDDAGGFGDAANEKLDALKGDAGLAARRLNEADTLDGFIRPVLDLLGWGGFRRNEADSSSGNRPDMLLFADKEGKKAGRARAAAILEAKRWNLPLDRRESESGKAPRSAPSSQMLRYLRDIDEGAEWGILTNGTLWRLYYRRANSKSEHFLELDLEKLLRDKNQAHGLRVFLLMFRRASFADGFHKKALAESRNWEEKITGALSQKIFDHVFPDLARALAKHEKAPDAARLRRIGDDTMILLFRLLFVLYAEDRGLLPMIKGSYKVYSLVALRRMTEGVPLDELPDNVYGVFEQFRILCATINKGNRQMQMPPYNGGLFSPDSAPLLEGKGISDRELTRALRTLSYHDDKRINYRDLSVQHLGAMYERFLELELHVAGSGKGQITPRPNRYARKSSGSYYTPEELVHLVIDGAVGVLLREYRAEFAAAVKQKAPMAKLQELDPAMRGLQIKVCDPAMGSGHFLVSLVDYLADWALAEIAAAEVAAAEVIGDYHSPLSAEIESVRERIKEEAKEGGWHTEEHHLDDRQIIRRLVLKRAVYGADKNPMAVELAKLSLWLHTFTVGAPLTFLDHHLRHGDSLFGEFAANAMAELGKLGKPLMAKPLLEMAQSAAEEMQAIESVTDSSIAEVHSSIAAFEAMREKSAPFNDTLSLLHCRHWIAAEDGKMPHLDSLSAVEAALQNKEPTKGGAKFAERAAALCEREHFIHWETAFPGIWSNWANGKERTGGFDAVIGNPPWDKMKMQEAEWFAERVPELESATQDARKKHIKKLRKQKNPIVAEYDEAARQAMTAMTVVRKGGAYPLMSGGDTNLYYLFAERAFSLAKPDGMVGVLTPSGIFGDLTAMHFFRAVNGGGRMSKLIDFINRPHKYFPDVDSRFKFCAFVAGGAKRQFREKDKVHAFSVNPLSDIAERRILFAPGDIDTINPNTGAVPIFLTQRDADITIDIQRRFPILRKDGEEPAYQVKYATMFHMTNDSGKFQKPAALEKAGYYREKPNNYARAKGELCLPLYAGRTIDLYNHRANSSRVNPDNPLKPNISVLSSLEQLRDANFCAAPNYWVDNAHVMLDELLEWFVGFRGITNSTNQRTIIASLVPRAAYANSVQLLLPIFPAKPANATKKQLAKWREECAAVVAEYRQAAPLLAANLSSFALDFVARQKMHGTALNWHIARQLPVIPPEAYKQKADGKTLGDFARERVLRLAYTAEDMTPFARDMGHKGKPFIWDEEKRMHWRAQLDALYFFLYGIGDKDAAYMMDTFPIIREDDEKQHGGYLTRDLIVNYLRAYRAGNWQPKIPAPDYSQGG